MNVIIRRCLIVSIVVTMCPFALMAARRPTRESPIAAGAVGSFYKHHFSRGMTFNGQSVAQKRRWFAPELYDLLLKELKREKEFVKTHPDEVPHFNGDPFTNSQEFPQRFRVGKSRAVDGGADVNVTFFWDERSSRGKDEREVVVQVRRRRKKWLIANFVYGDGKDLVSDLKRVEY